SRWAVYKWETAGAKVGTTVVGGTRKNGEPSSGLAAITASVPDRIPGAHTRITTKPTEEGRSGVKNVAECSAPTTKSGPDRRPLYVAGVNCCAQADQLSGGSRQVAVTEFAQVFMTQAACHEQSGCANDTTGSDTDKGAIYVEIINAVKANQANQV